MGTVVQGRRRADPARLASEVFATVADRLAGRTGDVTVFTETGEGYEDWLLWEALAACRAAGWTTTPRPPYATAGVTGSRDAADLHVFDPASGRRLLVEIALIHDWTTNSWIAGLNRDTERLRRAAVPGLQLVVAASLASPIEVNETWRGWLGMSQIWGRPTDLDRTLPLGAVGQVLLRGWAIGPG